METAWGQVMEVGASMAVTDDGSVGRAAKTGCTASGIAAIWAAGFKLPIQVQ